MGKSQSFNFDNVDDKYSSQDAFCGCSSRSKNPTVGPRGLCIGVICVFMLCAITGIIIYFAHPNYEMKCNEDIDELDDSSVRNVTWQQCVNLSKEIEQCFPCAFPVATSLPDMETTLGEIESTTLTSPPQNNTSLRLPKTWFPIHYTIDLKPDIYEADTSNFSFTGHVIMILRCMADTNMIYVHIKGLLINDSSVQVKEQLTDTVLTIQDQVSEISRDFYIITLAEAVSKDTVIIIDISYFGLLLRDMAGMYWSSYPGRDGSTKYMVATQFESTDARKAFPCLDEPQLKAKFNVSLWRKPGMITLSNMPNYTSQTHGEWIQDFFEETPILMPTYLVAFAVADYDFVENTTNGGPTFQNQKYVRVYSRPAFIEAGFGDYAAEITAPIFDFFEEYFNQTYSLPKTDHISIPDFSAGAMENWGLITYRESRLLDDWRYTTSYDKWRFTKTISHELLHQWLGNIVTCEWWGDVWLQEGAARYFENKAVQFAQPSWNQTQTYLAYTMYRALKTDQGGSSHPVHIPYHLVNTNAEADAMFSTITYDKGSTIFRLVETVIFRDHPAAFLQAMRQYVQEHLFSTAQHDDLLSIFDQVAASVGITVNVTQVMYTWIKQSGFPVVKATLSPSRDSIEVTQSHFLQDPHKPLKEFYPSEFNYTWDIPFSYIHHDSDIPVYTWMYRQGVTVSLPSPLPLDGYILGNHHQLGFYRVNYDDDNWEVIINQLRTDHQAIEAAHRAQLINDALNLAIPGEMDQVRALRLTEYLANETEWLPWYSIVDGIQFLDNILETMQEYLGFEVYMQNLVEKVYTELGWETQDTLLDSFMLTLGTQVACSYGNKHCIDTAVALFNLWKSDPQNLTIISPDLRPTVYCTAMWRSYDVQDWLFLFDEYVKVDHEIERGVMRDSLACTRDSALLQLYFEMGALGDERIYYTDYSSVMRAVARNWPTGHQVAYAYIDDNWESMSSTKFSVYEVITSKYSTDYDLQKFQDFKLRHPASGSDLERFDAMEYYINANIRWRNQNEAAIADWLEQILPKDFISSTKLQLK